MGIASLVLMGFWHLWRYYGFIFLSMYIRVKTLKYCTKKVIHNNCLIWLMKHLKMQKKFTKNPKCKM